MVSWFMKTPERWRALPRRALFVSILAQMMSNNNKWTCKPSQPTWKSEKSRFFNLATLTFDLWPSNSEILSRSTPPPNFRSVRQMVQPGERWQTNTHTHTHTERRTGPILYPRLLTREGKIKRVPGWHPWAISVISKCPRVPDRHPVV